MKQEIHFAKVGEFNELTGFGIAFTDGANGEQEIVFDMNLCRKVSNAQLTDVRYQFRPRPGDDIIFIFHRKKFRGKPQAWKWGYRRFYEQQLQAITPNAGKQWLIDPVCTLTCDRTN